MSMTVRAGASALVMASRPLSWINTAYPFAVAYALLTGRVDLPLVLGAVFFLVPYNLAMYGINDVFDYESDLRNPRKGGVEGALGGRETHRPILVASAVAGLPFCAYFLSIGSWQARFVFATLVFAVLAYSVKGLRFKERPLLDSLTSSYHFCGPMLYAMVLSGQELGRSWWLVFAAFACWGAASHAFGAVQDVVPDREAGIGSVATVLGAASTCRMALALYAVAGVLCVAAGWGSDRPWAFVVASLACVPYLWAVWPFRSLPDEHSGQANRGWRKFLLLNYLCGAVVTITLLGAVAL